jgi:hypothetical protein
MSYYNVPPNTGVYDIDDTQQITGSHNTNSSQLERGNLINRSEEYNRDTHKCYHNPDDWHEDCHDYYNCRSTWSLILALIALFTTLWPLSIISLCLIRRVKKTVHCGHRHSCKVFSAYWLGWLGVILGILEWIAIVLAVFETHRPQ